jgi:phage-related protein
MATDGIRVHIYGDYDNKDVDKAIRDLQTLRTEGKNNPLQNLGGSLQNFGDSVAKFGGSMTKNVTLPLVGVGVVAYGAIQAGSDLAESQSKVGQIFGETGDDIVAWSKTTADSMGVSQQNALDAASTFATFGKSAGLAGGDLGDFATDLTGLSSDLASFYNTSPEEAIGAIGAALRGESEPIRKYGVLLDDATLKQRAMTLGIYDGTGALTPQQKVLAAQAEILAQTSDAQGDFARTSDGLANQQRMMQASLADTTAEIGQALLPVALELVTIFKDNVLPVIQDLADWFKQLSPETLSIAAKIGIFAAALGPVILIAGKMISAVGSIVKIVGTLGGAIVKLVPIVAGAIKAIGAAFLANPILLAIAAIIAAVVFMYMKFEWFRDAVHAVLEFIGELAMGLWEDYIKPAWNFIYGILEQVVGFVVDTVWPLYKKYWELIGTAAMALWENAIQPAWNFIYDIIEKVVGFIGDYIVPAYQTYFQTLIDIAMALWENGIKPAFNFIKDAVVVLWDALTTYWGFIFDVVSAVVNWFMDTAWPIIRAAWDKVMEHAEILWNVVTTAFDTIRSGVETAIGLVISILEGIGNVVGTVIGFFNNIRQGIVDKLQAAIDFVQGIPGTIIGFFSGAISWLYDAGVNMIQGLINGAGSLLRRIGEFFLNMIPGWIVGPFKAALGISSPSKVFEELGRWIPLGLIEGVASAEQQVKDASKKLAKATTDAAKEAAEAALEEAKTGLDKAEDELRERIKAIRSYLRDLRSTGREFGSIMNVDLGGVPEGFERAGIRMQLQDRLATIRAFTRSLRSLQDMGLNSNSLREIVAAGPEAGLEIAQALVNGGIGGILEVNKLEQDIRRASSAFANVGTDIEFGTPGISGTARSPRTTNVNITVNAGVGDPREIGRQTVEAIKAYERANGRVFVSA